MTSKRSISQTTLVIKLFRVRSDKTAVAFLHNELKYFHPCRRSCLVPRFKREFQYFRLLQNLGWRRITYSEYNMRTIQFRYVIFFENSMQVRL